MNIKKTIHSIQQGKFSLLLNFLIPIKLIIIFWVIKIVNTFAVFIFLFFDKI